MAIPLLPEFVGNACECLNQELTDSLNALTQKGETLVQNKLDVLNKYANIQEYIDEFVMAAQSKFAKDFEAALTASIEVSTPTIDAGCFSPPILKFAADIQEDLTVLMDLMTDMNMQLPVLDLRFNIDAHVRICNGADIFTDPLNSILNNIGLQLDGSISAEKLFGGLNFPTEFYKGNFFGALSSTFNVNTINGFLDNMVSQFTQKIDKGVGIVTDYATKITEFFKQPGLPTDPSALLAGFKSAIPLPSTVAWAEPFVNSFGISPITLGGGTPKAPKDVSFKVQKGSVKTAATGFIRQIV